MNATQHKHDPVTGTRREDLWSGYAAGVYGDNACGTAHSALYVSDEPNSLRAEINTYVEEEEDGTFTVTEQTVIGRDPDDDDFDWTGQAEYSYDCADGYGFYYESEAEAQAVCDRYGKMDQSGNLHLRASENQNWQGG